MRTHKPLSTVSYNTLSYLVTVLTDLVDCGKVDFWFFVRHRPEEGDLKAHTHVYLQPACTVDTVSLRSCFDEVDLTKDKPLRCLPFAYSKFDDAYLYFLHDVMYLRSKGLTRKYHYTPAQVMTNDSDMMAELVGTMDLSRFYRTEAFFQGTMDGKSLSQMVFEGIIPINQAGNYRIVMQDFADSVALGGSRVVESAGTEIDVLSEQCS